MIPFSIDTGTGTRFNSTLLLLPVLLGLWIFDMLVRNRKVKFIRSRTFPPLIGLSLVVFLAFMVGRLPWFSFAHGATLMAQLGGLAVFLLSAGAFFLAAYQIQMLKWLQRLIWVFLGAGSFFIFGQLYPTLRHFTHHLFPIGVTGSLFWVWFVAFAFSQALFNRKIETHWRIALGCIVIAAFYINLHQTISWASGWLPSLVTAVIVLWVGAPRFGLPITFFSGLLGALNARKLINLVMTEQQYSLITRWEAWKIVVEIIKVSPLLGLGPANYYWYTPLIPILGWYVPFNSHNQYIDIIAQSGLLGFACFLWFVWEMWWLGWLLRDRVPEGGFEQAYVYGALGGLIGTLTAGMLADWVLPFVYNIGLSGFRVSVLGWIFLGGLVALEQIIGRKNPV